MSQLEVGMRITTKKKRDYRILAVVNHGQQILGQRDAPRTRVDLIDVDQIVQINEQGAKGGTTLTLDQVTVVGERYVDNVDQTLATLHEGEPVLLQREPDNQYDENAVSIWTPQHAKLGYLARYQNQPYAEVLDQGQLLYGLVTKLDRQQQKVQVMLYQVIGKTSNVDAIQIRCRLAHQPTKLATVPNNLLQTPLGAVLVTSNGRPIHYQSVPLKPWLTPDDQLFVAHRYLITPDWSQVDPESLVVCQTTLPSSVVQRWQGPEENAVVLSNATSFYVVGMSAQALTGRNDNLPSDTSQATMFYRVDQLATHQRAGFMVSWAAFGEPDVQPALRSALQFPEQPVVPFEPQVAIKKHATFTRQEVAALLVSALPNYQDGHVLEPSVTELTTEKIRVTLGDSAYHALANYQRRVQLAADSDDDVNNTLLQALIHAVIYHEIAALQYYLPSVGMVTQPVYPIRLYSTTLRSEDAPDQDQLSSCLLLYNYDTFELQQVPLKAISSLAITAHPEHPQPITATPNPDWLQIFMKSWSELDLD